jgi:hypothetical protein
MRTLLIGLCIVAVVEAVTSPALSQRTVVPYGEPSANPNEPSNQQERAQPRNKPLPQKGMPKPKSLEPSEGPNEPTSRGGARAK